MADTRQRPTGKVVTEHNEANAAIDQLREIAGVLKKVGDEAVGMRGSVEEIAELTSQCDRLESDNLALSNEVEELSRLSDAIADFDRGIIDRDELVKLSREIDHE